MRNTSTSYNTNNTGGRGTMSNSKPNKSSKNSKNKPNNNNKKTQYTKSMEKKFNPMVTGPPHYANCAEVHTVIRDRAQRATTKAHLHDSKLQRSPWNMNAVNVKHKDKARHPNNNQYNYRNKNKNNTSHNNIINNNNDERIETHFIHTTCFCCGAINKHKSYDCPKKSYIPKDKWWIIQAHTAVMQVRSNQSSMTDNSDAADCRSER